MSSDALPISPARFAEAIKDLPLSALHLKVLELRNSIAHLDYSNEQLRPFAEGTAAPFGGGDPGRPDQDCVDAIRENEVVIDRMAERIRLVRQEVESRGCSWGEFEVAAEAAAGPPKEEAGPGSDSAAAGPATAAVNGDADVGVGAGRGLSEAWRDGTIQTGVVRNGQVHMDDAPAAGSTSRPGAGGSLTDEQLRRALEERLRVGLEEDQDDAEDGGLHL